MDIQLIKTDENEEICLHSASYISNFLVFQYNIDVSHIAVKETPLDNVYSKGNLPIVKYHM